MNNARFHRFPVGQFSRILHRTTVDRCSDVTYPNRILSFFYQGSFLREKRNISRKCSNFGDLGRQNFAMITDRRKLTAKINLYGMSSFHFYCWIQFKVIALGSTFRTSGPNVSFAISHLLMSACSYIFYQIRCYFLKVLCMQLFRNYNTINFALIFLTVFIYFYIVGLNIFAYKKYRIYLW